MIFTGSNLLEFWTTFFRVIHADLIAITIASAATAILGFTIYYSNPRGATHRAFLFFALATIGYGTVNYLSYKFVSPFAILWLIRLTVFTGTIHAFSFMHLFVVFPHEHTRYGKLYRLLAGWTAFVAALTLTPVVFSGIRIMSADGSVSSAQAGPGILLFALTAAGAVISGIYLLIRHSRSSDIGTRSQARIILLGAIITFTQLLTFNLVLPLAFDIRVFIPFAPIYLLPLIAFTAYAIRRYNILNVKIIATEALTFILAAISMVEVVVAQNLATLLLRVGVFSSVLAFGILLIRSVIKEVQQQERLHELATTLKDANTRLRELDQIKNQFLSFASHQLKTPLTAIKWQSQLIEDGTMGEITPRTREATQQIVESVDGLVQLVNEFLDLRRIQDGRMAYTFEATRMGDFIRERVAALEKLAERKKLTLTTVVDTNRAASIDRENFGQVIMNLVDNAIKYTDTGSVAVHVADDKEMIAITVTDTGRGIDPAILGSLFTQFTRDPKNAKQIAGTGLGLYIARQIVTAHHGTIEAFSRGPGTGSTFTARIPASPEIPANSDAS